MNRNDRDYMTPRSTASTDAPELRYYQVTITSQTRYIDIPSTYPKPIGNVVGIIDGGAVSGLTVTDRRVDFGADAFEGGEVVTVVFLG